jgi:hypothetical protein
VEEAALVYTKNLPLLGSDPRGLIRLRDAWIRVAASRFLDGNVDGARDALRRVFVYDPKASYTPTLFPPQMKKAVVETQLLGDALGTGKLSVSTTPPGARVYLNGALKGTSPLSFEEVHAGPNLVTAVLEGYERAEAEVEAQGAGDSASTELALSPVGVDPLLSFQSARSQLGLGIEPAPLVDLSQRLGADLIIAVRGAETGAGRTLTAFLYDARSRQLLKKSVKSAAPDHLGDAAMQLAWDVLKGARLDGKFEAPPPPESVVKKKLREFRAWPHFWPVVGGAAGAVVLAGAITIGVVVAERNTWTAADTVIFLGTSR